MPNPHSYLRKNLLAWVGYPDNSKCFFPSPQYVFTNGQLSSIPRSTFPDVGTFLALTFKSPLEIKNDFGHIVVINMSDYDDNGKYEERKAAFPSQFMANYNPDRDQADFSMSKLANSALASQLAEIIDLDLYSDVFLNSSDHTFTVDNDTPLEPLTDYAMARVKDNTGQYCLVGPFYTTSRKREPDGTVSVHFEATKELGYFVYVFDGIKEDRIATLREIRPGGREGDSIASFVSMSYIKQRINNKFKIIESDWLDDSGLVSFVTNAIKSASTYKEITSELGVRRTRRLNQLLEQVLKEAMVLPEAQKRSKRLKELGARAEMFATFPDELVSGIAGNINMRQILGFMRNEKFSSAIVARLDGVPEARQLAEREKASIQSGLASERAEKKRLDAEVAARRNELATVAEKIAEESAKAKAEHEQELAELDRSCSERKAELEDLTRRVDQLRADRDAFESSMEDLTDLLDDKARLLKEVFRSEVVRRATSLASHDEADGEPPAPVHFALLPSTISAKEVIDDLTQWMERHGRAYSRNDVINLYICLAQGFMTTFVGGPGSGKTSLCRLLAHGIGLDAGNRRFVQVPVEKGWTSHRDFIGYYNPLSRDVVVGDPDVYAALRDLASEADADPSSVLPCLFLFDDANMSPIDYYLSDFFDFCDTFEGERPHRISLGGDCALSMPRFARFLLTANYDRTSEELSPRLLDRSWVIGLEGPDVVDADVPASGSMDELGPCLSYQTLIDIFGKGRRTAPSEGCEEAFRKVVEACRNAHHPISPRSQSMARSYMATATDLMNETGTSSTYEAADYAIAQKVLPTLHGFGAPEKELLALVAELKSACSHLPKSSAIIDSMAKSVEDYGQLQFHA